MKLKHKLALALVGVTILAVLVAYKQGKFILWRREVDA